MSGVGCWRMTLHTAIMPVKAAAARRSPRQTGLEQHSSRHEAPQNMGVMVPAVRDISPFAYNVMFNKRHMHAIALTRPRARS